MYYIYYILLLLSIVFLLLYYHLTSTYGYWKKKLIPCLDGTFPGLGHIHPLIFLKKNYSDMYSDYYNQMPEHSMIGFYNLRDPSLIIRDPELVKNILQQNFQNFSENPFLVNEDLDPLLSANAFFTNGPHWKNTRTQLTSAITSGKLKYMFVTIEGVCDKLKDYLNKQCKSSKDGKADFEIKELFSRYTAEVVASAVFGVEGGAFENKNGGPFVDMGKLIFEPSTVKGIIQMLVLFVPTISKILRMSFMPAKADKFFRSVVKEILKQREEQGIQRQDFLQLMVERKKNGQIDSLTNGEFNDDIITSHAVSFFGDGYETSSITLSFVVYQLAKHPEVQERLREEVNSVIAQHDGLTYEAIRAMTYMDQVLNESMRLFPAFGTFIKRCTEECELVGSDGMTCRVEPGMCVVIPAAALMRDPKYWPEPEKFDPERFSEENKLKHHKFTHLPFGEGPRICAGMRMALLQIKAAIATVIKNFSLEKSPRTQEPIQLDPNYFMSSAKGGLWVYIKPL